MYRDILSENTKLIYIVMVYAYEKKVSLIESAQRNGFCCHHRKMDQSTQNKMFFRIQQSTSSYIVCCKTKKKDR
jgi:hypothetical protein